MNMAHRTWSRRWVVVCAVGALGCGQDVPMPAKSAPTPTSVGPSPSARAVSHSHWLYQPASAHRMRAVLLLASTRRLLVGDAGERWIVDDQSGIPTAAALLAPSSLVAVTRDDGGVFRYVDQQGEILESDTPLGPLRRVGKLPSGQLLDIDARGKFAVALIGGRVFSSSDFLRSFHPRPWTGNVPMRVMLSTQQRAMLLAFPEQLWLSTDAGQTWSKSSLPTIGARSLNQTPTGELLAQGLFQSVVWPIGHPASLEPVFAGPRRLSLLADVAAGPNAQWFIDGSAGIVSGTIAAAAKASSVHAHPPTSKWLFAHGRLDHPLNWTSSPTLETCSQVLAAPLGQHDVAIGCIKPHHNDALLTTLSMFASSDDGHHIYPLRRGLIARSSGSRLRTVTSDDLLITKACIRTGKAICPPNDLIHLHTHLVGDRRRVRQIAASTLPDGVQFFGALVTHRGEAFALGRRVSDRAPVLLVSSDGGASFVARTIRPATERRAVKPSYGPGRLSPGPSGELSWVVPQAKGSSWLVIQRDGTIRTHRHVALDGALSVAGRLGLVVGKDGVVHESRDGGKTFRVVSKLTPKQAKPGVFCTEAGCVVGNTFTRLGWGPGNEGGVMSPAEQPSVEKRMSQDIKRVSKAISCVAQGQPVAFPSKRLPPPAKSSDVLLDVSWSDWPQVDWADFWFDSTVGQVVARYASSSGGTMSVRTSNLFSSPTRHGSAIAGSPQAEGVAALRFQLLNSDDRVEVAWVHLGEGGIHRNVLRIPNLQKAWQKQAAKLRGHKNWLSVHAGMLSVGHGGIYVCPFPSCHVPTASVWFVPNHGKPTRVSRAPIPTTDMAGQTLRLSWNFAHRGNDHDAWLVERRSMSLLHVRSAGDTRVFGTEPSAADLLSPLSFGLRWVYRPDGNVAEAWQVSGEGDGLNKAFFLDLTHQSLPPVVSPAPAFLPNGWRPCRASEGQQTTRVPAAINFSVPFIVHVGTQTLRLHATSAVLRGTASKPCVSSLIARASASHGHVEVLVRANRTNMGWLVTETKTGKRRKRTWQRLQCSMPAPRENGNARHRGTPSLAR